ncbi:hypothetical protein ACTHR6_19560 [Ralstonia holmesii]|uniref:hypothetical protein n=1 Tax=Ralstonia TaxID=48736 RepID=UPI000AB0BC3E|nr:hypothetical protein [Ralstonia pickettii]
MTWTPSPQGDSGAPQWLKTAVTLAYRASCVLLALAALAFPTMQLFHLPNELEPLRLAKFCVLVCGVLSVSHAWRIWLLRLPVPIRFSAPVPYGYPGWRPILRSQLVSGCVFLAFGVALFFL